MSEHPETGASRRAIASRAEMSRRLARAAKHRRSELGLSQEAVARGGHVTLATLRAIEQGRDRGYQGPTLAGLDRALGWEVGHAQGIVDGERLEQAGPVTATPDRDWIAAQLQGQGEAVVEAVTAAIGELARLEAPFDELVALARRLERRDLQAVLRLLRSLAD